MKSIHRALLCSTAAAYALSLGLVAPAYAETAAPEAENSGIADIVVTANRREQSSQSVPIAISAVSGAQIRELGISTGADLTGKIPSVFVSSAGTTRNVEVVVIRGQGQTYLAPVGVVNYFADVPLIQGGITAVQGAPGMFFDLESMQVLRGPQGTLFGRNTTGGAVLLGPKKPTGELDGYVQAQIGNYNDRELQGAINIPIFGDKLAIRIAATRVDRDGYTVDVGPGAYSTPGGFQLTKVCAPPPTGTTGGCTTGSAGFAGRDYDDRHYWHARVGVLIKPTDSVENYLVGYYGKEHDNGTGFVLDGLRSEATNNLADNALGYIAAINTYNANGLTPPLPGGGFTSAGRTVANSLAEQILDRQRVLGARKTASQQYTFHQQMSWGVVNTLKVNITDTMLVKSITGYQRLKQNYSWDLDGSILPILSQTPPFATAAALADASALLGADASWLVGNPGDEVNITNQSVFSQELQLQGSALDKKLQYVVGGYYSKQKPEGLQATGSFNAASRSGGAFYAITTQAKAVFAQASLDFGAFSPSLDGLSLTGGIRETWDELSGNRYASNLVIAPLVVGSRLNSKATTWTVGLDYQANRNLLVYGKVTRGYKAGAFNYTSNLLSTMTAKPEFVTSYEAGFKSDFRVGEMPVRFNANVFHVLYSDIQKAASQNSPNGCDASLSVVNPAEPARCNGVARNQTGLDQGAIIFNAKKAEMTGLELELVAQPIDGLRLSGSYSYISAKYVDFIQNLSGSSSQTRVDTCDGEKSLVIGVEQPFDFSCIPFQLTPKNIVNLGARYEKSLGDSVGTLAFSANFAWVDKVYSSATRTPKDDPNSWMDGYGKLDVSVEWNSMLGSNVDMRLFSTNVTNTLYRVHRYPGLFTSTGFTTSLYGEPRMFGASVRYRFGASAN